MQFNKSIIQLFNRLREKSAFIFSLKLAYVRVVGLVAFVFASGYASLHSTRMYGAVGNESQQQANYSSLRYGFDLDTFYQVKTDKIAANESFKDFVEGTGLSATQIDKINRNCNGIFDVRHFRTGKDFMILTREKGKGADYFCYAPDLFSHLIINLKTLEVQKKEVKFETRIESASGIIESNIWNTMVDNGWSFDITDRLEDALSCAVDFYHTDQGDKFKFIYENRYVNGKAVSTGNLLAAYFTDNEKEYYAIWYDDGKVKGFFDAEGRPMKKYFLKSPVRFSHISSGFNLRRLHPVLRYVKPHLGTDFAAPTGTPIMAVADGIVEEAARKGGNGIYVKIRHDHKYETQYLHMCRHASGIRRGVHVSQGQVIGYVGSTGLATGPHVCFRFWKNGVQCNFQKADLPAAKVMDPTSLPNYKKYRDEVIANLAKIPYRSAEEIQAAKTATMAYKP